MTPIVTRNRNLAVPQPAAPLRPHKVGKPTVNGRSSGLCPVDAFSNTSACAVVISSEMRRRHQFFIQFGLPDTRQTALHKWLRYRLAKRGIFVRILAEVRDLYLFRCPEGLWGQSRLLFSLYKAAVLPGIKMTLLLRLYVTQGSWYHL